MPTVSIYNDGYSFEISGSIYWLPDLRSKHFNFWKRKVYITAGLTEVHAVDKWQSVEIDSADPLTNALYNACKIWWTTFGGSVALEAYLDDVLR